jgi:hypothetical protein
MKETRKLFIAALLPFIFLWYIGCISLTPHTHIVDGVSIVHSHPVSTEGHQHSAEETLGIELICHFDRDLGQDGIILPAVAELFLNDPHFEFATPYVTVSAFEVRSLRAPPCFS